MKKVILSTISLAVLVFGVGSCKKSLTHLDSSNVDDLVSINFKSIGEFHNAGLEHIFQRLIDEKKSKSLSHKDAESIIQIIDKETINFARSSKTFGENDSYINESVFSDLYNKCISVYKSKKIDKSSSLLWLPDEQVTENIERYFEIIESIFESDDFEYRKSRLTETLEELYNGNIPEYDKFILLTTYEVAIHSDYYWHNHWKDWSEFFEEFNKISEATTKKIAFADLGGAAVAAGAAWWANVVAGPGTIGYGVAIGGGALGSSAYEAVTSFLHWLFP